MTAFLVNSTKVLKEFLLLQTLSSGCLFSLPESKRLLPLDQIPQHRETPNRRLETQKVAYTWHFPLEIWQTRRAVCYTTRMAQTYTISIIIMNEAARNVFSRSDIQHVCIPTFFKERLFEWPNNDGYIVGLLSSSSLATRNSIQTHIVTKKNFSIPKTRRNQHF